LFAELKSHLSAGRYCQSIRIIGFAGAHIRQFSHFYPPTLIDAPSTRQPPPPNYLSRLIHQTNKKTRPHENYYKIQPIRRSFFFFFRIWCGCGFAPEFQKSHHHKIPRVLHCFIAPRVRRNKMHLDADPPEIFTTSAN
jgi:hypothetical protein